MNPPRRNPKRKSTESPLTPSTPTTDDHNEQKQTPSPSIRVTISSSTTLADGSHSFEPSPDFKIARDKLFQLMPQQPHFKPLEKFPTSLKGFRVVLDLEFVNLAQKLSDETVSPVEFFDHVEEYSSQLTFLQRNGYDVGTLQERFCKLKEMSEDVKKGIESANEYEVQKKDKQAKASVTLEKIDELKKELKVLEDTADAEKKQIEELEFKEMSSIEVTHLITKDFSAALSAPWVKEEEEIQEKWRTKRE